MTRLSTAVLLVSALTLVPTLSFAAKPARISLVPANPASLDRVGMSMMTTAIRNGHRELEPAERAWLSTQLRAAIKKVRKVPRKVDKDNAIHRESERELLGRATRRALWKTLERVTYEPGAKIDKDTPSGFLIANYLQQEASRPSDAELKVIAGARDFNELHRAMTRASQAPYYSEGNMLITYTNFGHTPEIVLYNHFNPENPVVLDPAIRAAVVEALRSGQRYIEPKGVPYLAYLATNKSGIWTALETRLDWERFEWKPGDQKITFIEPIERAGPDGARAKITIEAGALGQELADYTPEQRAQLFHAVREHRDYEIIEPTPR
jgi:hypothetical protein